MDKDWNSDPDWDAVLADGLLQIPDDFSQHVMQRIRHAPVPVRRLRWSEKLQNLALIFGGILGLAQLAAFMFGIWTASAAG